MNDVGRELQVSPCALLLTDDGPISGITGGMQTVHSNLCI
jgi:hypothetical protein